VSDKGWQQFEIFGRLAGETVGTCLRFLVKPEPSWGEIRKLLAARKVLVNGNLCQDDARRLAKGDRLRVLTQSAKPLPRADQLRLIHVDPHLLIVEKPAGLLAVRHIEEAAWSAAKKQAMPTLEELLPAALPPSKVPHKIFPVHRLDRDTSGLMVFARTRDAEVELVRMFKNHTLERKYITVVRGQLSEPAAIKTFIARDRGDGKRGSLTQGADTSDAQEAITHVQPLERVKLATSAEEFTIVMCTLETGRTHQIRIHLSERGHPVVGDKIYYAPPSAKLPDLAEGVLPPRQALHAASLAFDHPITKKPLAFVSELPTDLRRWLDRLVAP
jgi:23S rRNA pseudouridine1911/1915/1917 synthase